MASRFVRIASRAHSPTLWFVALAAVAGLATALSALALAQDAPAQSIRTEFHRRHKFEVPVAPGAVDERTTADKEIRLFYSADRGRTWQRAGTASTKARAFTVDVTARGDGEYLFALMLATTTARDKPDAQYRPGMRAIVDTQPPKVELSARRAPSGAIIANWRISDPLIDRQSLQITAGPANSASPDAMKPVAFDPPRTPPTDPTTITGSTSWFPSDGDSTVLVRAQVTDRAGNPTVTTVQVSLADDGQAPPRHFAAPPSDSPATVTGDAPQSFAREASLPRERSNSVSQGDGQPGSFAPPASLDRNRRPRPGERQDWANSERTDQTLPRRNEQEPVRVAERPDPRRTASNMPEELPLPNTPANAASTAARPAVTSRVGESDGDLPPPLRDATGQSATGQSAAGQGAAGSNSTGSHSSELPPGERPRVLASRRISLQYDVDSVGPSGVAEVELFTTTDGGRTWASLGLDADNRSPFTATLPGEGLYGFRLVVRNGNRVGGKAPAAGDLPEMWIVVDETKPVVAITAAEVRGTESGRELVVRFEAADSRLAARPVSLFYSEKPSGPWEIIAASLENTGSHSWPLDRRLADRVYLRLEVQDEAGNIGAFESANAIVLDESEPVGRIRSVESPRGASVQQAWPRYR